MKHSESFVAFEGVLERSVGPVGNIHIIRFPHSVPEMFGTRGHVRVKGRLNGVEMERSLIPAGDGTHYLIINQELRRLARAVEGSMLEVELERTEHRDLDLPEELEAVLELDEAARDRYWRQSDATRRDMIIWISQAKRQETRERRALDLLSRLQSPELIFGGRKGKE